jgi:hypothetical protein
VASVTLRRPDVTVGATLTRWIARPIFLYLFNRVLDLATADLARR